jgi:hypothetical protein
MPVLTSTVNYLGQMQVRPVFYAQHVERNNLVLEPHTIRIDDARRLAEPPSLESRGFTLVPHRTKVADFTDRDTALPVYQQEIEALVLGMTGARKVVVGNMVLRWSERAGHKGEFVNSHPARFVHVDYSRESFEDFARRHLGDADDAESWLARRYVAYNVWRVTSPPPQDVPLAVCDARTVSPGDVTTGDAVIDAPGVPEFRFGSSLFHFSVAHRWFYYPQMQLDEALVFKAFDSDNGRVPGCPHSGFDDPTCPAGVPPRSSVEIRAYAFF